MRYVWLVLAALAACAPRHAETEYGAIAAIQEPIQATTRTASGNLVQFGSSCANRPEIQRQAVAAIQSAIGTADPSVAFVIVQYPAYYAGKPCISWRSHGLRRITLSWQVKPDGSIYVGDADWECRMYLAWTDDFGRFTTF